MTEIDLRRLRKGDPEKYERECERRDLIPEYQCQKCPRTDATRDICPFADEIHNDYTLCHCCEDCRQECLWEI